MDIINKRWAAKLDEARHQNMKLWKVYDKLKLDEVDALKFSLQI